MGSMMADFYDRIVCREDRGAVYAPVALMWDLHHGYMRWYSGAIPWGMFVETEGDRMMPAVEDALFPVSDKVCYRSFRTSPFGDIFDVITNNISAGKMNNYPVIFFCGDVPIGKRLADQLVSYVRDGGTLIVNWKQIEPYVSNFPDAFLGAEVSSERREAQFSYSTFSGKPLLEDREFYYCVAKPMPKTEKAVFTADQKQDPLVLVSAYGKGKVILTMPDYLKEPHSCKMLKIFGDLMQELSSRILPVEIKGNIQYQVNRNRNGWVVSLFNNYGSGMVRTWDDPQKKAGPEYTAEITVTPKFPYKSVREWFTGERKLSLSVPPGEVRILEIAE